MECQASDSKKVFKVFDASERKRSGRRRDGGVRSAASDGSTSGGHALVHAKSSLQDVLPLKTEAAKHVRNIDSSPSMSRSQTSVTKVPSSPRRHRRPKRDATSLALKGRGAPSPGSISPPQEGDVTFEALAQDKSSFIYTFLEEAIKRGKKKHRHSRRQEERDRTNRARGSSPGERRDHRDHRDQPEQCDQPILRDASSRDRLRDSRDQHDSRDQRDCRERRDTRDPRDERDRRDLRDQRDLREHRDSRDQRAAREQHDQQEHRPQRDHRDHRGRDYSGSRDHSDQQAERDLPDQRDKREHREDRTHCDQRSRRREDDDSSRGSVKPSKIVNPEAVIDQKALIETFAKLCATITTKTDVMATNNIQRTLSHKSLQCEGAFRRTCDNDVDHRPVKLRSQENSQENVPASRIRSQEDNREIIRSRDNITMPLTSLGQVKDRSTYCVPYDREETPRERCSRLDMSRSKMHNLTDYRCREYELQPAPTISCIDQPYRRGKHDSRIYRESNFNRKPTRDCDNRMEANRHYDQERIVHRDYDSVRDVNREKYYDEENRRYFDQKTSRSFDVRRDAYVEDEIPHRTARSEIPKERRYDERRYDDRIRERLYEETEKRDKYYEDKPLMCRERKSHLLRENRERRNKNYNERIERASICSRDDEYKDKDSGLSVADGESVASARSNNLKLIKQEIAEQRENMDAMMNLWKDLMRCFKSTSQASGSERAATETAANNAREGAATQLRLWRECMRRYETVARDVGDTDARLMEEINKQRSEMAEMSSMWQECLRRYREMSSDFNNLKQKVKLAAPGSPVRPLVQPVFAEGEGPAPPELFQQPVYPPVAGMGYGGGSPIRARASAPPAWWWGEAAGVARPPRARRSSPDSPDSRDHDRDRDRDRRRHKDRERDDSRYKEKSKPSGARSEHRRRKR